MIRTQVLHAVSVLRDGGRVLVADDDTFVLAGTLPNRASEWTVSDAGAGLRIHVGRPSDLQRVLSSPPPLAVQRWMARCWPGPEGVVLPLRPSLQVLFPPTSTLALHQTSQPALQELLLHMQVPLVALPLLDASGSPVRTLADAASLLPREAYRSGIAHAEPFSPSRPPQTIARILAG